LDDGPWKSVDLNAIENGLLEEMYFEEERELLSQSLQTFPHNPILKAYLSTPTINQVLWDEKAPEWANLIRNNLIQLDRIIQYWLSERQMSDGQFGGGWGDDVELWRKWTQLTLAFTGHPSRDRLEGLPMVFLI